MQIVRSVQATSVGTLAVRCLRSPASARILGVTSSGVFLNTDNEEILFLTTLPWRGPFSINLRGERAGLSNFDLGEIAVCSSGRISFPRRDFEVILEGSPTWSCQNPGSKDTLLEGWQTRVQTIFREILSDPPETPLLPFMELLSGNSTQGNDPHGLLSYMQVLVTFETVENDPSFSAALRRLIGFGGGLTPSGDDLIQGLAYCLAHPAWPTLNPARRNHLLKMITQADLLIMTNRISQNLICAAARGEVEERLWQAFDWVLSGKGKCSEMVAKVRSWGNTSGTDSLVGFCIGLIAQARLKIFYKEIQ